MNRLLTNLCTNDVPASKNFYSSLFDFRVEYDSDWFVHLISKNGQLELGIIDAENEIVPKEVKNNASGFYITFVVENADDIFEIAKAKNIKIISEPHDTFYGQRRLLLQDPNGVVVDVSSPRVNF